MATRPRLPKASIEMQRWSAALGDEISAWPHVSSRPMFGMLAFYRGRNIFAALPRTRAVDTPCSLMVKLPDVRAGRLNKGRGPRAGWLTFEMASDDDLVELFGCCRTRMKWPEVAGPLREIEMRPQRYTPIAVTAALFSVITGLPAFAAEPAKAVKVTVLSTMLAGDPRGGIGEWGFAALLEVDGRKLLIDTGARPETVLRNVEELGIDLSDVTELVITHNHGDHTAGLVTLRRAFAKKNPRALSRAHVAKGIFVSRPGPGGRDGNGLLPFKAEYESLGGTFVEHAGPVELMPSVWFTGPVPRPYPERNWIAPGRGASAAGVAEDTIPEDASVVVDTPGGLVLVSGCGHAGIINTLEFARKIVRPAPVVAAIGGFHLFAATDSTLEWTASKLREFGLQQLLGAHCTGIEAVYRLRALVGLTRATAVVGAVGSSFTLGKGISALSLAS